MRSGLPIERIGEIYRQLQIVILNAVLDPASRE